jgi:hypothetical protein
MTTILHKIRAWLYENFLTKNNPNDYIARVESDRSLGIADICESAATRGGADVSAAAMQHAVELFLKEMGYRLCDGFSVNTGWFTASVHIHGTFDSKTDTFDPQRHTVLFEFHQGALLRKELELVDIEIKGVAETGIVIAQVTDVKTGSINDLLTPNRNLKIAGHRIKIAGEKDENGVYFIDLDTQKETKVDASDFVTNNPSDLVVVIPDLAAGTYRLKISTQFGNNVKTPLKDPRSAVFDRILTVK